MKSEAFGFSGDGHDLGVACSSGLPFRHSHESGNPGSMNSKMDTRLLPRVCREPDGSPPPLRV
jgi:hypothetical protein